MPRRTSEPFIRLSLIHIYIHRNTLVYRLDKLQKSTGLDLRVFEDAITFKIALMVVKSVSYTHLGDMLANALMAGACSVGANCIYVGVIHTHSPDQIHHDRGNLSLIHI